MTDGTGRPVRHVPAGEGRAIWLVGDTYTFKATADDTNGAFTLWEAIVPPQAGPPPHIHHWQDEGYYILEGQLEVLDHDRTIAASAGSFVHIPRGRLHEFKNPGPTETRMLIFMTPGGFEQLLFAASDPVVAGGSPSPLRQEQIETLLELAPHHGYELPPPPQE